MLVALMGKGQINDFAPLRAQWRLYWASMMDRYYSGNITFHVTKDTLVGGKVCRKIQHFRPSILFLGMQTILYHFDKDTKQLFRWNAQTSSFLLEIDFSVKVGESFTRQIWDPADEAICEVTYHVNKIDSVPYLNADTAYFYFASITSASECIGSDIGHYPWQGCTNVPAPERAYEFANFSSLYGFSGHFLPRITSTDLYIGLHAYSDSIRAYNTTCNSLATSRLSENAPKVSYQIQHQTLIIYGYPNEWFRLSDALGKTLIQGQLKQDSYAIDLSDWASGVYLLSLGHQRTKLLLP